MAIFTFLPGNQTKRRRKMKTSSSSKVGQVINSISDYMREDCEKMLRRDDHIVRKIWQSTIPHSNPRQEWNKNVCVLWQKKSLDLLYQERFRSEVRCRKWGITQTNHICMHLSLRSGEKETFCLVSSPAGHILVASRKEKTRRTQSPTKHCVTGPSPHTPL